jgi:hypothetical protein
MPCGPSPLLLDLLHCVRVQLEQLMQQQQVMEGCCVGSVMYTTSSRRWE